MVGDHPAVSHHHHFHKTRVGEKTLRPFVALLFSDVLSLVAICRKRIHFQAVLQHLHIRQYAAFCPLSSPVFPLALFVTMFMIYDLKADENMKYNTFWREQS